MIERHVYFVTDIITKTRIKSCNINELNGKTPKYRKLCVLMNPNQRNHRVYIPIQHDRIDDPTPLRITKQCIKLFNNRA